MASIAAASPYQAARTLSQSQNISPDGQYNYEYSVDNGIQFQESGFAGNTATGRAAWVDPQGVPVEFTYTADENGYVAHGSHVPQTPEYITRALAYIRSQPAYDDSYTVNAKATPYVAKTYTPYKPVTSYKSVQQTPYKPAFQSTFGTGAYKKY